MAKVETFKAKEVLGQDYTVLDTNRNIQKIDKCMKAIYEVISKLDSSKDPTLMDYNEAISKEVIKGTADLLKLSKDDADKLVDMSYSEIFDFYSKAVDKFTGMRLPSVRQMQEAANQINEASKKDPKQSSDK